MRFGAIVDAVGDEDAKGDEELVAGDHATADLTGCGLGLVHGSEDGESANAQTCNPAAESDLIPSVQGGHLDDNTNAENNIPENDGKLPAERVCDRCADNGANEGTDRQQGNDRTRADLRKPIFVCLWVVSVSESLEEVLHLEEARDLTSVVTEDETAKRHDHDHGEDARSEELDW